MLIAEKAATNLLAELSLVAVLSLTKWFFPIMAALYDLFFKYFQVKTKLINAIREKKYTWLHLKSCRRISVFGIVCAYC